MLKTLKVIPGKDWRFYKSGYSADTVHSMKKTKEAFRIIVIRRPYQRSIFSEKDNSAKYTVIATNKIESSEEVIQRYNKRGDHSENRIKEPKIGFGMERMPCGQFEGNSVFFRIGVLAYNIFRLFLLKTLSVTWHKHQIHRLRWRLYQIAGKVVFHGGQVFLKVNRRFSQLFFDIRLRIWEFFTA